MSIVYRHIHQNINAMTSVDRRPQPTYAGRLTGCNLRVNPWLRTSSRFSLLGSAQPQALHSVYRAQ